MGYSDEVASWVVSAPPRGMAYLTGTEAARLGIEVVTVPPTMTAAEFGHVNLNKKPDMPKPAAPVIHSPLPAAELTDKFEEAWRASIEKNGSPDLRQLEVGRTICDNLVKVNCTH